VVVTDPKTPSGRRVVTLPPVAVVALLRQWQERQSETLVFTGARGGPLHVSVVEHALGRECRRLGIPVVTPRSLRHLHASLLLGEGLPITAVSARLGHANPSITLGIYSHALGGQDEVAAAAIGRAMGG